ncbi:MAG: hypothetical protein WD772_04865 [Pseudohongiellaceae bacterium]
MIELDGECPFLWRLSAESSEGFCAVSMVVPYQDDDLRKDLTIETTVVSLSSDSSRSAQEEMLEWNQDDINLFLKMVNYQRQLNALPVSDTVRIDLSDPSIIEIIHVVAAAGFGTAYTSHGVLLDYPRRIPSHPCPVGAMAALNTVSGYRSCVVVAMEEEEVVCVLLEDIQLGIAYDLERLHRHDLLLVNRDDLLHPEFGEAIIGSPPRVTH